MAVVLALAAALSYGVSDFVGGFAAKRAGAWTIALVGQLAGAVAVGGVALVLGGEPRSSDVGWALLAGVGNGTGTAFLYRGLSAGRMGVVAPVSGVGAAVLPVVAGAAIGERPVLLVWLGIVAALPAIALVASEPSSAPLSPAAHEDPADVGTVGERAKPGEPAARRGSGLVDGVLAGLGFGTLFVALAQIPEESGLLPLSLNLLVGAVVVLAVALLLRERPFVARPAAAAGIVCGCLGAAATVGFLAATHTGLLTVAAVITSLYPASTILLAAVVLRERVHRVQGVGLVLCAVAVTLVALG